MKKNKLISLKVIEEIDNYPDTSLIGEYSNKIDDGYIIRYYDEYYEKLTNEQKEELPQYSREYRSFKPYAGGEKIGTKEYYEYGMQDYKRMEQLNNCYFYYVGILVQAQIEIKHTGYSTIKTITSPGIWGIESDCDIEYKKEIIDNELLVLQDELKALNVSLRNFKSMANDLSI